MGETQQPSFRHIVLTRFNLRVDFNSEQSWGGLGEEWLRSRLELFLRYSYPSVRAQTAPVDWVVYIDSESPRWFVDELGRLEGLALAPVEGLGSDAAMQAALRRTGLVDRPFLITTRLDSDDAVARGYAASVQGQFRRQAREFVEFPIGYQLIGGRALYTTMWRSNPFLSLIEDARDPERVTTVFSVSHSQVLRSQPTRTLWRPPMWLQSIHEVNTSSGRGRWTLRAPGSRPSRFSCDWDGSGRAG